MSKKMGFLAGLILGGAAAFAAFKHLDPAKRQKLIDNIDKQASNLKNKAVDYAFYASDAMNDASNQFQKGTSGAKSHAKSAFDSAHQHAAQLKDKFNNKFTRNNKVSDNNSKFDTAAGHLQSELDQKPESNDIVINASDNFKSKQAALIYYPDGTVRPF